MKQPILFCLWIGAIAVGFAGCNEYNPKAEGPNTGVLKIGIDESYTLMMDSQVSTFEQLYKRADVVPTYMPESEVMKNLMNDSIQEAVVCRKLTAEEEAYFASIQRLPETTRIAIDGLALVVNRENPDTNFTMARLQSIFSGTDSTWTMGELAGQKMAIVFDNIGSCNARTVREVFLQENSFPSYCFSANSNKEVMEYVQNNKNAMGIISVSWVSDQDDPTSLSFLKMVRVCGIRNDANPLQNDKFRKPYQAYIYDGTYPLCRDVYVIRTGLRGTLGTGFASFLAGEKGQLIIKKMGMAPISQSERTIIIKREQ